MVDRHFITPDNKLCRIVDGGLTVWQRQSKSKLGLVLKRQDKLNYGSFFPLLGSIKSCFMVDRHFITPNNELCRIVDG